jgi:hypothetical protein
LARQPEERVVIAAAHQTMLAPRGAPLGSVEFTRGGGLNNPLRASGILSAIPSAWTVSLWAKAASASEYGGFFKLGNQDPGSGEALGVGNNTNFQVGNAGTKLVVLREAYGWDIFGDVSPINVWNHYALTVSGNTLIAYKNGTAVATKTGTLRTTGNCDIAIGGGATNDPLSNQNRLFAGNITRVSLWGRALSASEVAADYADGNAAPSTTTGLEHFWPMSSADNYLADAVGSATLTAGTGGVTISTDSPFA